ncbi:MAG TPA: nitroreductase family deazaflavin-dependent oxidoreductase, partial [Ktedonobacterales bacterium]|nr:nitroreductase family deazaflavin-dependent oxidoreductase [Ktedonobacterales bacterium]
MWPLWVRHRLMRCADVLGQGIYRASGGLIGERQWTFHMLLLDSIGRKSGKTRTHTLLFFRDGERFIVVASNFADPKQPAWYWNLRDHPHAHIQVGRNRLNVAVTEAEGEERNRLWQMALTAYAKYAVYQQQTSRRIPVMVLTPEPTTPNLSPD